MSWNARRFARVAPSLKDGRVLHLWLSADAQARLQADGGYVPDVDTAVDRINETLEHYDQVIVGIAERPNWYSEIYETIGNVLDPFDGTYILTVQTPDQCKRDLQELQRHFAAQGDADMAYRLRNSMDEIRAGGRALGQDGEPLSLWGVGALANEIGNTIPETVAAALTLYADPQARSDAACVQSIERVQVMKPAKAKRAKESPMRDVHVIDVKRPALRSVGDGRSTSVEHDHRWVVRGHWRNQPCGKGRTQRRRIWIQEHVAGPEDKPLRRDTRVYRIA